MKQRTKYSRNISRKKSQLLWLCIMSDNYVVRLNRSKFAIFKKNYDICIKVCMQQIFALNF